jgi:hypothetical protein
VFTLSAADIALVNPNTRTCPIFLSQRDAEITKRIYERVPVLIREGDPDGNPWGISFRAMFHMSNDSHLFRTRSQLEDQGLILNGNIFENEKDRYLPLYEAKMIHQFDHRWATYDRDGARDVTEAEKQNPHFEPLPRYWVHEAEVQKALPETWDKPWLMGWRDICRSTDERTVISSLIPRVGVGHTMPLFFTDPSKNELLLGANLNSISLDYLARQKIGGTHLTYGFLKQLPLLTPDMFEQECPWQPGLRFDLFVIQILHRLFAVSDALHRCLTSGSAGFSPWDWASRANLRAELDAGFFLMYGIGRDDVGFILDQFPVLKKNEEARHGEFLSRRLILEHHDKLSS